MKLSFVDDEQSSNKDEHDEHGEYNEYNEYNQRQQNNHVNNPTFHRMPKKKRNLFVVQAEQAFEAVDADQKKEESGDESATLEWEAAQMKKVLGSAATVNQVASDGQLDEWKIPDYNALLTSVVAQHDRLVEQITGFKQQLKDRKSSIQRKKVVEATIEQDQQHIQFLKLLLERYHIGEDIEMLKKEWQVKYPKDLEN